MLDKRQYEKILKQLKRLDIVVRQYCVAAMLLSSQLSEYITIGNELTEAFN